MEGIYNRNQAVLHAVLHIVHILFTSLFPPLPEDMFCWVTIIWNADSAGDVWNSTYGAGPVRNRWDYYRQRSNLQEMEMECELKMCCFMFVFVLFCEGCSLSNGLYAK